jgi:hypothetical protein
VPDLTLDLNAALAYSIVPPYMLDVVISGWRKEDDFFVRGGFVMHLTNDQWAYITFHRSKHRDFAESSTEFFAHEPTYLYSRGVDWVFDKEHLNAGTQVAKQKANYPTGGLAAEAAPGRVVRIPV